MEQQLPHTRGMNLTLGGVTYYTSSFDPRTGALVRALAKVQDTYSTPLRKKFPNRYGVASPVPETVDVKITQKCAIRCRYCYQDSLPNDGHADPELAFKIIEGFDQPPYGLALGGGEPCQHPDLPEILKGIRERGTVPSYTTAGHVLNDKIAEATNKYAGSVAMTYHAFRGLDTFLKQWRRWKEAVTARTVIHLICDDNVVKNLRDLADKEEQLGGPQTIVLLAYYTAVGRSEETGYMKKKTYMVEFPALLMELQARGWSFAYSEGMLPYFLSRPELGIGSKYHRKGEGYLTCYVDDQGIMHTSSFDVRLPKRDENGNRLIELTRFPKSVPTGLLKTVFNTRAQELWENLRIWDGGDPGTPACGDCEHQSRCNAPQDHHYLSCAYQGHNKLGNKAMEYEITFGMGHVTNSSSCIHYLPKKVLENPVVKAFIEAYEIKGHVGEEIWSRSRCGSILLTQEDKIKANHEMMREEYGKPLDCSNEDEFIVIYGDEYHGIENVFAHLCNDVAVKLGLSTHSNEYN